MKSRIQHDFGKAASSYDRHARLQREVASHLFALSQPMLRPDAIILDAGCSTGYFHELARSHRFYGNITQLDLAFPMCQLAASYASSPPFGQTFTVAGDCEMLPFAADRFDGIFTSLVMQWTDITRCAHEFARLLKPQGSLAIATVGTGTLNELVTAFQAIDDRPHVNEFAHHSTMIAALEQAGFTDIALHQEKKTVFYPSVLMLMRGLKYIGARYKQSTRKSLYGKGFLEKLELAYKTRYAEEQGNPSTWNIDYFIAKK